MSTWAVVLALMLSFFGSSYVFDTSRLVNSSSAKGMMVLIWLLTGTIGFALVRATLCSRLSVLVLTLFYLACVRIATISRPGAQLRRIQVLLAAG